MLAFIIDVTHINEIKKESEGNFSCKVPISYGFSQNF